MSKSLFALLLPFILSVSADAADWRSWGGPNANFTIDDAGVFAPGVTPALRIVWKRPLGTGYASVSVAGETVVTMFSDGVSDYLAAYRTSDGEEIWRHRVGPAYLGHWGSQNGPLSTPLLTDDAVVALGPRGRLFSVGLADGRQRWSVDLVQDLNARAPFWGFTSSPRLIEGRVVLQTGGAEGMAVSAFDPATGRRLWSAATDEVDYQSFGAFTLHNASHVVFHGNTRLAGIDPADGTVLWSLEHGGATSASSTSSHPVEIAEGQYFVKNSGRGAILVRVSASDDGYVAEKAWDTRNIGGTYIYPVYRDGVLFGYRGRILTALDAATGERIWRSREPGDGLPLIVDGHLVIITKEGKLAVAPASRDGYSEVASLQVFDDIVWSPAALSGGRFYLRSMGELACVEVTTEAPEAAAQEAPGRIPGTAFDAFVGELAVSADQQAMIDRFLTDNPTFPVVEGDSLAHFVYLGDVEDVATTGDHVGRRIDVPMHPVSGTNLFYFSSRLEPDARITYRFTVDLQEAVPDPRNPNEIRSLLYGNASWFGMPGWREPDFLVRGEGPRGEVRDIPFVDAGADTHRVRVYLPPGYADGDSRYPVVYLHDVRRTFSTGLLDVALDNLVGNRVAPVIAVITPAFAGGGYNAYVGERRRDAYLETYTGAFIPFVDRTFRTVASRAGRANYGTGRGGFMAFYAAVKRPDTFGGFAIQSTYWDQTSEAEKEVVLPRAETLPAYRIYLDWGRYDARSPMEGNDTGRATRQFAEALRERGYTYVGGQVNDGSGWGSWRNRLDRVFGTLFPVSP